MEDIKGYRSTLDPDTARSSSMAIATHVTQESCPYRIWMGLAERDWLDPAPDWASTCHTMHVVSAEPLMRCEPHESKLKHVTTSVIHTHIMTSLDMTTKCSDIR